MAKHEVEHKGSELHGASICCVSLLLLTCCFRLVAGVDGPLDMTPASSPILTMLGGSSRVQIWCTPMTPDSFPRCVRKSSRYHFSVRRSQVKVKVTRHTKCTILTSAWAWWACRAYRRSQFACRFGSIGIIWLSINRSISQSVFTARRYNASPVYAVVVCPSVCPSVRHTPVVSELLNVYNHANNSTR